MGFRYRKRIRIAPGLSINISKSGVSTSIGGKGATLNISGKGVRSTVGVPGTGLSYSSKIASFGARTTRHTPTQSIAEHEDKPGLLKSLFRFGVTMLIFYIAIKATS